MILEPVRRGIINCSLKLMVALSIWIGTSVLWEKILKKIRELSHN